MRKEIQVTYNPNEEAFTIRYLLHGDKAVMQFVIRCPTPAWNYYLPMDIGCHAKEPQYEGQKAMEKCGVLGDGKCYYDGTSLGAEELWQSIKHSNDYENLIWQKLEEWMNEKFK